MCLNLLVPFVPISYTDGVIREPLRLSFAALSSLNGSAGWLNNLHMVLWPHSVSLTLKGRSGGDG